MEERKKKKTKGCLGEKKKNWKENMSKMEL